MRRVWAMLLVGLAGFSLAEPALVAGAETPLPECCRRMGQHHCASTDQDSSGIHFRNAADRCPYFPGLPASPVQRHTSLLNVGAGAFIVLVPQLAIQIDRESTHYTAYYFAHPKRGPPVVTA